MFVLFKIQCFLTQMIWSIYDTINMTTKIFTLDCAIDNYILTTKSQFHLQFPGILVILMQACFTSFSYTSLAIPNLYLFKRMKRKWINHFTYSKYVEGISTYLFIHSDSFIPSFFFILRMIYSSRVVVVKCWMWYHHKLCVK